MGESVGHSWFCFSSGVVAGLPAPGRSRQGVLKGKASGVTDVAKEHRPWLCGPHPFAALRLGGRKRNLPPRRQGAKEEGGRGLEARSEPGARPLREVELGRPEPHPMNLVCPSPLRLCGLAGGKEISRQDAKAPRRRKREGVGSALQARCATVAGGGFGETGAQPGEPGKPFLFAALRLGGRKRNLPPRRQGAKEEGEGVGSAFQARCAAVAGGGFGETGTSPDEPGVPFPFAALRLGGRKRNLPPRRRGAKEEEGGGWKCAPSLVRGRCGRWSWEGRNPTRCTWQAPSLCVFASWREEKKFPAKPPRRQGGTGRGLEARSKPGAQPLREVALGRPEPTPMILASPFPLRLCVLAGGKEISRQDAKPRRVIWGESLLRFPFPWRERSRRMC